ncbi:MAG: MBL fold metallo-hydrolase, partial [Microgenomates group bacterium]
NTIYIFEADGLRLAHMGDLGHDLNTETLDAMGPIDILMIPVGGEYTIGPKEAVSVITKVDPYFIIPMHYKADGMNPEIGSKLESLETFLKEVGIPSENTSKFSIKKDEILEDQNSKVIVLERK